jgi:hypothetical protein
MAIYCASGRSLLCAATGRRSSSSLPHLQQSSATSGCDLPPGNRLSHRIRHFGFLSNCHRTQKLALCRELLGMAPAEPATDPSADYRDRFEALTGQSLRECPHCRTGIMVVVDCIARPKVYQAVPDTS